MTVVEEARGRADDTRLAPPWIFAVVVASGLKWSVPFFVTISTVPGLQAALPPTNSGLVVAVGSVLLFVASVDLLASARPSARLRRIVGTLSDATFGVFLVHLLLVVVLRRWWPDWYANPAPVDKIEMYLVVVVGAFAISLLARRVPVLRKVF